MLICYSPPHGGSSTPAAATSTHSGPLLPELARLQHLERLYIVRRGAGPWGGVPPEWLQKGAFPRLTTLVLEGSSLSAPLPDIPPGALPALTTLELSFPEMPTPLPASWGARPVVLPALQSLSVLARLQGSLPEEWDGGFKHLSTLILESSGGGDAGAGEAAGRQLPASWTAGFPALKRLDLRGMGLSGTFPLHGGGFPKLLDL